MFLTNTYSQTKYNYTIYDSPVRSTMYASNQNYLSSYRIFARETNRLAPKYSFLIQAGVVGLFGVPLTHEEGHRSVLTNLNIGSISMPFFNEHGAAYVKGVTDATLENLRANSLADYIHLHTAGLESDYQLSGTMESLIVFEEEQFSNLFVEYVFRKISIVSYLGLSFSQGISPELIEEDNELDRDIVGHDVWGAIRHLHRPQMKFKRYTNYDDLTTEEKDFANRVAWRSLANLASPMLFGYKNFKISDDVKINASLGYTLAPFGDFIDQNIWLIIADKYKIKIYLREFQNKNTWFPAGGLSLTNYKIIDKLYTSININLWQQPENLSFTTSNVDFGGGANLDLSYSLYNNKESLLKDVALNTGMYYKTKSFLPEYAGLDENFGLRIGFGFSY